MRKTEKDVEGRFHFSEREYYATRELFGIVNTFNKCAGELKRRTQKFPGGWRDLRLITVLSEKLLIGILRTVPLKKLAAVRRELENTEMIVQVKRTAVQHSENEIGGYTYVPQRALERITQRVVDYECFCCERHGADAKHCPLRKDIESTYMFEYPCRKEKECPFQGLTFGGEYERIDESD